MLEKHSPDIVKKPTLLQINFKKDIVRLFEASELLKDLLQTIKDSGIRSEIEEIIKDLRSPNDKAFLSIDFRSDILRLQSARERLIALKTRITVDLHEKIDKIAKQIR